MLRNALGYGRESTKDQSNYSPESQHWDVKEFCESENFNLLDFYFDEGKSGGNFDRPQWKRLEKKLSKERSKTDFLVVPRFDRFARNAMDALNIIHKIEKKWNIRVLSATEGLPRDYDSPAFFLARMNLLATAEYELLKIKANTTAGTYRARVEGRKANTGGYGWDNIRDERNKSLLIQIPHQVKIAKFIINAWNDDMSVTVIHKEATKRGFPRKGHSAIQNVVFNLANYGLNWVPKYKGRPGRLIDAIQSGFMPKSAYFKALARLQKKEKQAKTVLNDNVYLRPILLCGECFMPLTGGETTAKLRKYWYYRCIRGCKCKNHNTIFVHPQFIEMLNDMTIPKSHIDYIISLAIDGRKKDKELLKKQSNSLKKQLSEVKQKLFKLGDKYIAGKIDDNMFAELQVTYNQQISEIKDRLFEFDNNNVNDILLIKSQAKKLENLGSAFEALDVVNKQRLVKHLFPGGLYRQKKGFTTLANPILNFSKSNNISNLNIMIEENKNGETGRFPVRTRSGGEIQPQIITDLTAISGIFLNAKAG